MKTASAHSYKTATLNQDRADKTRSRTLRSENYWEKKWQQLIQLFLMSGMIILWTCSSSSTRTVGTAACPQMNSDVIVKTCALSSAAKSKPIGFMAGPHGQYVKLKSCEALNPFKAKLPSSLIALRWCNMMSHWAFASCCQLVSCFCSCLFLWVHIKIELSSQLSIFVGEQKKIWNSNWNTGHNMTLLY